MTRAPPKRPPAAFTPDQVRDISVAIYKNRLEASNSKGAVERMIANDKDSGQKLRGRAGAYDALTRAYLDVLSELDVVQVKP